MNTNKLQNNSLFSLKNKNLKKKQKIVGQNDKDINSISKNIPLLADLGLDYDFDSNSDSDSEFIRSLLSEESTEMGLNLSTKNTNTDIIDIDDGIDILDEYMDIDLEEESESMDFTDADTYTDAENQRHNVVANSTQLKSILEHSIVGHNLHHFFIPNTAIHRLTIQVASNNIFCTLKNMDTNTMFYSVSSGSYKIIVTKRSIKKNTKDIIESFFKGLQEKNFNYTQPVAINITAPSSFKKFILEILDAQVLSKINVDTFCYVDINPKKKFNGCRAKKLVNKKRLSLSELV